MRSAHRVAAHLLEYAQPEVLQAVGQRNPHASVILVVAGSLNLERFAVKEESLLRIELYGAHTEGHALGIAHRAVHRYCDDRRVKMGFL